MNFMVRCGGVVLGLLALGACDRHTATPAAKPAAPQAAVEKDGPFEVRTTRAVIANYANLVHANYLDSLEAAEALQAALVKFVGAPSEETLRAAREAWMAARVPYMQTECFRFYDGPIDRDAGGLESLLNAWPMDESYVDYVAGAPQAGIINLPKEYPVIDKELVKKLNEQAGETNISTGYHAIEFLLWGQDLFADGPGRRPVSDYVDAPNAQRRGQYLLAVGELLVDNLRELVREWDPQVAGNYREQFLAMPLSLAVQKILIGVVTLCQEEVPGERLGVAYYTQGQEDEQSCFSDNTHEDMVLDMRGVRNVVTGQYDGRHPVSGPGLAVLVETLHREHAAKMVEEVNRAVAAAEAVPAPFDRAIIGADTAPGRVAVANLIDQVRFAARALHDAADLFGLEVPMR